MCDSEIAYRMDLLNTQLAFRKSRLAARTFTIKCKGSERARAVRKYEVIESIQFSTDSYLSLG